MPSEVSPATPVSRTASAGSPAGTRAGTPATAGTSATAGTTGEATPEWAVQALDKVDEVVGKIRSVTTDRLVRIARMVVFGVLAAIMGLSALIFLVIAAVRALDEAIPGPVWSAYLPLGAIFTLAGAFLWSKKAPRATSP